MWVKVEVSQLSFIGEREEVEMGERKKYNIHNTLVKYTNSHLNHYKIEGNSWEVLEATSRAQVKEPKQWC